jgi:uncharacterized membrane protein
MKTNHAGRRARSNQRLRSPPPPRTWRGQSTVWRAKDGKRPVSAIELAHRDQFKAVTRAPNQAARKRIASEFARSIANARHLT